MKPSYLPFTHDCGHVFCSSADLAAGSTYLGEQDTGSQTYLAVYSCHRCGSTFSFIIRKSK